MKKVLALLSVCAMLSLAACNNANDVNENDNADTTKVDATGTTVETTVTEPAPVDTTHMSGDTTHKM